MSNEDYWKQVCNEYEIAVKIKDSEISNLREENFQLKHKKASIMDTLIIMDIHKKSIKTVIICLSNGQEIAFVNFYDKEVDYRDDYLLEIKNPNSNMVTYIDINEIVAIKAIMRE